MKRIILYNRISLYRHVCNRSKMQTINYSLHCLPLFSIIWLFSNAYIDLLIRLTDIVYTKEADNSDPQCVKYQIYNDGKWSKAKFYCCALFLSRYFPTFTHSFHFTAPYHSIAQFDWFSVFPHEWINGSLVDHNLNCEMSAVINSYLFISSSQINRLFSRVQIGTCWGCDRPIISSSQSRMTL